MPDVIQTHDSGSDSSGPSAMFAVLIVLLIIVVLLLLWWLFLSGNSPLKSGNTTNINIQQRGGSGTGTGGTGGSTNPTTSP